MLDEKVADARASADPEINAIGTCLQALEPFDKRTQLRIARYALNWAETTPSNWDRINAAMNEGAA